MSRIFKLVKWIIYLIMKLLQILIGSILVTLNLSLSRFFPVSICVCATFNQKFKHVMNANWFQACDCYPLQFYLISWIQRKMWWKCDELYNIRSFEIVDVQEIPAKKYTRIAYIHTKACIS